MTTQEVANRLVELCRQGKYSEAHAELYSDNATSVEHGGNVPKVEGIEGIQQKAKQYSEMIEEYFGGEVSDAVVADDFFSVMMSQDVKFKGQERSNTSEICVFEVKDGKIISEEFFYNM